MGDADTTKPLSWRDVYEAVNESRQEVTGLVNDLSNKVETAMTSHEHRLTVVEAHQANHAEALTDMRGRVDRHGEEIGHLKDQQRADEAVTAALSKQRNQRIAWRRFAIPTVAMVVAGFGGAILGIFVH